MNYSEMTAAQCADWLAEKDGWTLVGGFLVSELLRSVVPSFHPFPLTLDAAAGALREPWKWDSIEWWDNAVIARYFHGGVRASGFPAFMQRVDAPDELTARYRAAVAARMEEEQ